MKNFHFESDHRDAYWQTTREQLKSAQNRADLLSVLGLLALAVLLWVYHEPGDGFGRTAMAGIGIALLVIGVPLMFVTRRKRSISAARGLTCQHCGYVPHDTQISEVAQSRECPHCAQPLG